MSLKGCSVLITGGSGSFGQAFVKRILQDDPERVIVFSRDEHKQARMAQELEDERLRFFIGDVRDRDRLRRAFDGVDTVVHAAALKRIEVGAYNPGEMIKTNVLGAMNVIEAAQDAGVEKVVALSTDKAYQPVSPYGQSKALAETLFLNANNTRGKNGPIYACTRYGNVWKSAGSVVPKWREILKSGDTVPITDPNATRYFMWMREAVNLVLYTIGTMKGGELNIPDLPAYRMGDLAVAMNAKVCEIGMPEYEKRHETLVHGNTSETARRMKIEELWAALKQDDCAEGGTLRLLS